MPGTIGGTGGQGAGGDAVPAADGGGRTGAPAGCGGRWPSGT